MKEHSYIMEAIDLLQSMSKPKKDNRKLTKILDILLTILFLGCYTSGVIYLISLIYRIL